MENEEDEEEGEGEETPKVELSFNSTFKPDAIFSEVPEVESIVKTAEVPKVRRESKGEGKYDVEEIRNKIIAHITNLSAGKKMNLINIGSESYDEAIHQIQKNERLAIIRALRDSCGDQPAEASTILNSIIPDMDIKIEDLPVEKREELSSSLKIYSDEMFGAYESTVDPDVMFQQAQEMLSELPDGIDAVLEDVAVPQDDTTLCNMDLSPLNTDLIDKNPIPDIEPLIEPLEDPAVETLKIREMLNEPVISSDMSFRKKDSPPQKTALEKQKALEESYKQFEAEIYSSLVNYSQPEASSPADSERFLNDSGRFKNSSSSENSDRNIGRTAEDLLPVNFNFSSSYLTFKGDVPAKRPEKNNARQKHRHKNKNDVEEVVKVKTETVEDQAEHLHKLSLDERIAKELKTDSDKKDHRKKSRHHSSSKKSKNHSFVAKAAVKPETSSGHDFLQPKASQKITETSEAHRKKVWRSPGEKKFMSEQKVKVSLYDHSDTELDFSSTDTEDENKNPLKSSKVEKNKKAVENAQAKPEGGEKTGEEAESKNEMVVKIETVSKEIEKASSLTIHDSNVEKPQNACNEKTDDQQLADKVIEASDSEKVQSHETKSVGTIEPVVAQEEKIEDFQSKKADVVEEKSGIDIPDGVSNSEVDMCKKAEKRKKNKKKTNQNDSDNPKKPENEQIVSPDPLPAQEIKNKTQDVVEDKEEKQDASDNVVLETEKPEKSKKVPSQEKKTSETDVVDSKLFLQNEANAELNSIAKKKEKSPEVASKVDSSATPEPPPKTEPEKRKRSRHKKESVVNETENKPEAIEVVASTSQMELKKDSGVDESPSRRSSSRIKKAEINVEKPKEVEAQKEIFVPELPETSKRKKPLGKGKYKELLQEEQIPPAENVVINNNNIAKATEENVDSGNVKETSVIQSEGITKGNEPVEEITKSNELSEETEKGDEIVKQEEVKIPEIIPEVKKKKVNRRTKSKEPVRKESPPSDNVVNTSDVAKDSVKESEEPEISKESEEKGHLTRTRSKRALKQQEESFVADQPSNESVTTKPSETETKKNRQKSKAKKSKRKSRRKELPETEAIAPEIKTETHENHEEVNVKVEYPFDAEDSAACATPLLRVKSLAQLLPPREETSSAISLDSSFELEAPISEEATKSSNVVEALKDTKRKQNQRKRKLSAETPPVPLKKQKVTTKETSVQTEALSLQTASTSTQADVISCSSCSALREDCERKRKWVDELRKIDETIQNLLLAKAELYEKLLESGEVVKAPSRRVARKRIVNNPVRPPGGFKDPADVVVRLKKNRTSPQKRNVMDSKYYQPCYVHLFRYSQEHFDRMKREVEYLRYEEGRRYVPPSDGCVANLKIVSVTSLAVGQGNDDGGGGERAEGEERTAPVVADEEQLSALFLGRTTDVILVLKAS